MLRRSPGGLRELDELDVEYGDTQTNMVFVKLGEQDPGELTEFLQQQGIIIRGNGTLRLVTHLDISESDIERVVASFKAYLTR